MYEMLKLSFPSVRVVWMDDGMKIESNGQPSETNEGNRRILGKPTELFQTEMPSKNKTSVIVEKNF